uniref:Death domain-containing protein n=1 Tax=Branchiostoma floridae TaxID=7739 RepID=C3ZQQ4_BRAFL|eukprot:XP_002589089.1 hypothetical protein BRAFLDRAFT_213810 [Branchiostoma floridae]
MEERHREILRAQLPYLRKDLRVKYVLPELKKEGIILPAMEEEIMAVPTFEEQVDMLVNLLETRGPHAFKAFVAVIEGTYRHLAEGLRQEDNMGEFEFSIFVILCVSTVRQPTTRELFLLCRNLGAQWEQVLTQLGLTQDDISHAKTTHPDSKLKQIQTGLLNWREKYGVEATVDKLCEGLTSRNVDTTLFQFLKGLL